MESTISIEQFREELQSWKYELSAIKDEVRHFERNLEIMAAKKLPRELLAQVEHFQNLFICQKEVIDKLRHDLPDSRNKVENIFNSLRSPIGVEQPGLSTGDPEDRMNIFRRIYIEIKLDFLRFEEDWM
jgi:predicted RNase H-like nuclease (RuvC/YqgF family)